MIGISPSGARSSLKPPSARSPASATRRKSTVSATWLRGRSNGIAFQPSMIRSEEAPIPSAKRPPEASATAAASWASSARPRCRTPTTPVPSRADSVQVEASTRGLKPSGPLVSPDQRSV